MHTQFFDLPIRRAWAMHSITPLQFQNFKGVIECIAQRPGLWAIKEIGCAISGGYRQTIEILQTFFANLKVCLFAFCEIFELVRKFSIFRIRLYRRDLVELLKYVKTKFKDSSIQPRTDLSKLEFSRFSRLWSSPFSAESRNF